MNAEELNEYNERRYRAAHGEAQALNQYSENESHSWISTDHSRNEAQHDSSNNKSWWLDSLNPSGY
jgi:hypothetical protein